MSRVLEHHAKALLARWGIPVPTSIVIDGLGGLDACERLEFPLVVKALVPSGKKALGGGVRVATDRGSFERAVTEMLGSVVNGFDVSALLIEQFVRIERELFLSISFDALHRGPQILLGASGGLDVEAAFSQDRFFSLPIDPLGEPEISRVRSAWSSLGLDDGVLKSLTGATMAAWNAWQACEALLLEINPLAVLRDASVCAAGVLLRVDDDALFRHPEMAVFVEPGNDRSWRSLNDREREVLAVDAAEPYRGTVRYTEMAEGDIGNCGAGGGGSLVTFDLLMRYGLSPANFAEFGGNPSQAKVHGLISAIVARPGLKALLINSPITNNTRTDEVAKGIISALRDVEINPAEFPIVIRMAGVNDGEARRLLNEAGLLNLGEEATMEDAIAILSERLKRARFSGDISREHPNR